jgi:threonine dehydratase
MNLFDEAIIAQQQLQNVISPTPLVENTILSEEFEANILLKREDLHKVRSYKIRGAFNKINSLTPTEKQQGIVCASAGNHAQGVAFSCNMLQIKGKIYMPKTTPKQKIKQVSCLGNPMLKSN